MHFLKKIIKNHFFKLSQNTTYPSRNFKDITNYFPLEINHMKRCLKFVYNPYLEILDVPKHRI